jgi:hypothetical protein
MRTTFSSDEFNQDIGRVKRAAEAGPVFITDRGSPTHVFMTFAEYERITGNKKNILDLVGMKGAGDINFEPAKIPSLIKPSADLL